MAFALLLTVLLVGAYLAGTYALQRRFERSAMAFATTVFGPTAIFIFCRCFGLRTEAYLIAFAAFVAVAFYWFMRAPKLGR